MPYIDSYPISIADAKSHLRLNNSDSDAYLSACVGAATDYAQNFTQRQFLTTTKYLYLDKFPSDGIIQLPYPPVQSVISVEYVDTDGVTQTVDSDNYVVDIAEFIPRVYPAYNLSWPTSRTQKNAVSISYYAGYGNLATDIPDGLAAALKFLTAHYFENREAVAVGISVNTIPLTVDALLNQYRVMELS